MPIRAESDQGDLHAFEMNGEQWQDLKASHKAKTLKLWMPCCKAAAIPKTSTRGTFFFAHARRDECTSASERPEHLYCKSLIAKAAMEAGWTVTTERPGVTPDGEEWIADVFCERGDAKLAFEVQMSPQTDVETERRQQRYKASGVRGAWFFGASARKGSMLSGRDTPAFRLHPLVVGDPAMVDQFEVSLPEFIKAMLQKRLKWTIPRFSRPHLVEFIEDECWACKKPVKQVLDHEPGGSSPDDSELTAEDFYQGRWDQPAYTVASISSRLQALHAVISNDELKAQGLNTICRKDVIKGKPTGFPFCNMCIHCRAPQNNHFLSKLVHAANEAKDQSFGDSGAAAVALIPREIKGPGLWVLDSTTDSE